jgi:AraC-like DNA-binding protein
MLDRRLSTWIKRNIRHDHELASATSLSRSRQKDPGASEEWARCVAATCSRGLHRKAHRRIHNGPRAGTFCLSNFTLFQPRIQRSFGIPPHRYVIQQRIERGKTLLAGSALSIAEIGLALGFSRTSSFSAAFRKITGISPTEYCLTQRWLQAFAEKERRDANREREPQEQQRLRGNSAPCNMMAGMWDWELGAKVGHIMSALLPIILTVSHVLLAADTVPKFDVERTCRPAWS